MIYPSVLIIWIDFNFCYCFTTKKNYKPTFNVKNITTTKDRNGKA